MNRYSLLSIFSSFLYLSACSINTKLDDADYRPVGASPPINPETHSLTQIQVASTEQVHKQESGSTRYVRPGEETRRTTTDTKPKSGKHVVKPIISAMSHPGPSHQSLESSDAVEILLFKKRIKNRYGQAEQILKIYKTVQIHCRNLNIALEKNTMANICQYQFPKF